jgi:hypothetical protein
MSASSEKLNISKPTESPLVPLVFISHDSRDSELAEAFSKLLKSVSAGMLKSFRSSDKKGAEGIEFGDEWYKTLMSKLDAASDVVCLLTERSLDRPWILYEAGVAKGKLGTPVHGLALGVPLSRVSTGPFYQFQNSDDTEDALSKLVRQLCGRIAGLEPDADVVKAQVNVFKASVAEVLKNLGGNPKKTEKKEAVDEGAVAKVLEEMKLLVRELPLRLEQHVVEGRERLRPRRFRRFHPKMMDELAHMISRLTDDPIGILIIASVVRDDLPWLYEIGLEAYRVAKSGKPESAEKALRTFRDAAEMTMRGQFIERMGFDTKETHLVLRELPMVIDRYMHSILSKHLEKGIRIETPLEPGDQPAG